MTLTKIFTTYKTLYALPALLLLSLASCEKFVDIPKAPNQLLVSDAYKEDATAMSAVLALYSNAVTNNVLANVTFCGGIESDEMVYNQASDASLVEFQNAAVSPTNSTVANYLWGSTYQAIGKANVAIDGLNNSTTLTPSLKTQLLGECKFFRAFNYFYLVNYFGDVPLALNADGSKDAYLPRTKSDSVYAQMMTDLKDAENSLPAAYANSPRTRVNKYAAAALLARVYLFKNDYTNAAAEASKVIGATDISYGMEPVETSFLTSSKEVVLQIATTSAASNLPIFGTAYMQSQQFQLAPNFTNGFEAGDKRKTNWTQGSLISKYKLGGNEYNITLRLAEQYLIRAEARAQLNQLSDAKSDIDSIRTRAGLAPTTASTQQAILDQVAKERKLELFGEFAHRWFDLKRTGKSTEVLSPLKPGWKATAVLQPVPQTERTKNANLTQNEGYAQ
ncbi:RagB/SusD family nutrient uptake outer membrane protein [Chitinophagaceae bacterium 26-R-25]|nr:RagB/SusD family nutrient uptake outer membrane protein [Chitinophagaceae bacterium 26-R-25]